jgi:hypothetical protein
MCSTETLGKVSHVSSGGVGVGESATIFSIHLVVVDLIPVDVMQMYFNWLVDEDEYREDR